MRLKTAKELFNLSKELYGSYKRYLAVLVVLGFFGGILESFGISILVPLFSHILDKPLAEAGSITKFFAWFFEWIGIDARLRFLFPLILFVFVARALVLYVFEWIRASLSFTYERVIRGDLYRGVLKAPWRYLISQRVGFVENTVMVDVERTTKLLQDITNAILQLSSLLVYVVIALMLDPYVALITLVAGGALLIAFKPFLRLTRDYAHATLSVNKDIAHDINESAVGLKTIKALGVEHALSDRARSLFGRLRMLKIRQTLIKQAMTVFVQPASVLFIVAVFAFAFSQPDFNFAIFVVTIFLIQRIFIYIERVQSLLNSMASNLPYAKHVATLSKELRSLRDNNKGDSPFIFTDKLQFVDVAFSYPDRSSVLEKVSFSIPKNSTLALVGPSGSGKTTIVDLILQLLEPSKGSIIIDGKNIRDVSPSAWSEKVGYVAQDVFLINDTVENNIRFFNPEISDEDVSYAIKAAHLKDFVSALPNGIQTKVGERGVELSGGERQRISLARTLARRPEILVLDEATSALDMESERTIRRALGDLNGSITMIIVAHRLETLHLADTVLMLRDGNIVESGSPKELLADSGSVFSALYDR